MTLLEPEAVRLRLRELGHSPIPVNGKRPLISGWQKLGGISAEDLSRLTAEKPDHTNTGALTALMPVLDIDIKDPAAADAAERLVHDRFSDTGKILVRVGMAPKRAIPFQTAKPYDKIAVNLVAPNGDASQKIELLCAGQQVVVNGIHPDTGKPYAWIGADILDVERYALPHLNEAEARELVRDVVELLVAEHGYTLAPIRPKSNGASHADAAEDSSNDWSFLTANILAGRELHDSIVALSAKLIAGGMKAGAVVNLIRGLMQQSAAPRDERWRTRYDDIPRIVDSAWAKYHDVEQDGAPIAVPFIDYSHWGAQQMPNRDWAVLDRIPLRQTSLFSGEGGTGKSSVALHLCCAHVLGRDWLGSLPEPGPAIFIDAEDDENEIHIRLGSIVRHYDVSFKELHQNGLHLISFAGRDAVLATVSRSGKVEPTALYRQILQAAHDIKPKMIGIASSANVFAGNENDRTQVQQFVGLTTGLAIAANGTVQLISHPSLTGISSDSGLSGSTAWHNAVRSRIYMKGIKPEDGEQPDDDLRELVFRKNQYGRLADRVVLKYTNGMFLPVPGMASLDRLAQQAKSQDVFITLLQRFSRENRNVSANPGRGYAPAVFAGEDEAKKAHLKKADLRDAMRQLFQDQKIWNEPYGIPSRQFYRVAVK
jgi:RecA-family ATPase